MAPRSIGGGFSTARTRKARVLSRGTTIAPVAGVKNLLCLFLVGCAPSYWVQDYDFRTARNRETVPATRSADADADPLRLKAETLDGVTPDQTKDSRVRVTPRHPRNTIGWAIFGVGAVLAAAGIGAGLSAYAPCSGDEGCWLPQLVTGSTLGTIGGVSMIIGGVVAASTVRDAEVR
jgi:hypothetical protein